MANTPHVGLSHLQGNQLRHTEIPGISSDYFYLGLPGSAFTIHLEDYNLHSLNFLQSGWPKGWIVVPPAYRGGLERIVTGISIS